jgi:hypothetical protein
MGSRLGRAIDFTAFCSQGATLATLKKANLAKGLARDILPAFALASGAPTSDIVPLERLAVDVPLANPVRSGRKQP